MLALVPAGVPAIAALNKIDAVKDKRSLLPRIAELAKLREFAAIVPVSAERGTVLWDGELDPTAAPDEPFDPGQDHGRDIAGSLRQFIAALREGREPMGRVHANIMSLAMVEAATQSAAQGRRVAIDDVLDRSYDAAIANERDPEVLAVLKSWPSVREALSAKRSDSE